MHLVLLYLYIKIPYNGEKTLAKLVKVGDVKSGFIW
jgi:hypothetical protein